jgi:hypothetical protein
MPFMILPDWSTLTIRPAKPGDRSTIARLAALDSQEIPDGPLLLGEVGGEPWAAVSPDGAIALADPFRPSADVVSLLHARARQLRVA